MAKGKEVMEPYTTFDRGHRGFDEGEAVLFGEFTELFGTADVLSGRGVVGH